MSGRRSRSSRECALSLERSTPSRGPAVVQSSPAGPLKGGRSPRTRDRPDVRDGNENPGRDIDSRRRRARRRPKTQLEQLGDTVWFWSTTSGLEDALAGIPAGTIKRAYRAAHAHRATPARSVADLRAMIAADHRRIVGTRDEPRLVPVRDAAAELGISPRTVRRQIERGEREAHYVGRGRNGVLAIELPANEQPRRRILIPGSLRPDPRTDPKVYEELAG